MSIGCQSSQDEIREYSFSSERSIEGETSLNLPLNEGLVHICKSFASTDCCSLDFLSHRLNPSFTLDFHHMLAVRVRGLGGSRVSTRDAICVIGCLCLVSGSHNFSCNTMVAAVTQQLYKSQ